MSKSDIRQCSRRQILASIPPLACCGLAVPLIGKEAFGRPEDSVRGEPTRTAVATAASVQEKPGFWAPFTLEEQKAVDASVMAQDVLNYAGHGYGCAECSYMVGLRYMGEPEERLSAAGVLSGGFSQGDLCGFLTGSMLAIGVAAGKLHKDRESMRAFSRPLAKEYWEWWESRGPLHCSDLRELYAGDEEFFRVGQRAVAKLEDLIAPARQA
jgi:hypothetical protein